MDISELLDRFTGERKYLNMEEGQAFFHATTFMDVDIKFYCQMIYYTGCRRSEALAITPNDIEYSERVVKINTLKQKKNKPLPRLVELPDVYLTALHDVYGVRRRQGTKTGVEAIWSFTEPTAQNYISKVMAEAGISGKKATARGLRHSMGVLLVQNKVPMNIVQKILGTGTSKTL